MIYGPSAGSLEAINGDADPKGDHAGDADEGLQNGERYRTTLGACPSARARRDCRSLSSQATRKCFAALCSSLPLSMQVAAAIDFSGLRRISSGNRWRHHLTDSGKPRTGGEG
jgi:hypothetical protein